MGLPNFIEERLSLARLPEFVWNALSSSPLENHHRQLSRNFDSPKMRALLSFQDLYVGKQGSQVVDATSKRITGLSESRPRNKGIERRKCLCQEPDRRVECLSSCSDRSPSTHTFPDLTQSFVLPSFAEQHRAGLSPYTAPAVFSLLQVGGRRVWKFGVAVVGL